MQLHRQSVGGVRRAQKKIRENRLRTLNLITKRTRILQIGEDKRDKVKEKTHPKETRSIDINEI